MAAGVRQIDVGSCSEGGEGSEVWREGNPLIKIKDMTAFDLSERERAVSSKLTPATK